MTGCHLWLPFTQMATFSVENRTFVRGSGSYLFDAAGHRLFDAISSVWTTIHGHGHPLIVEAIARQAAELDHATGLGAANPRALELAERLATATGLDYAFFSSDGASAVEVALKIALQYWQQSGRPQRTRFARLTHSYHGDTAGAMSVSDIPAFKQRFSPLLFETFAYDALPAVLEREDIAAVIVEPHVQAAAGMLLVPERAYDPLRDRPAGSAPLLIVDEIATGFGRTGTLFAFERLGIEPDLLCLGKGITGGTLPLSATMARTRVHDAFLGAFSAGRHLLHGHSYAGNPIACAAALANLEVFEREGTLAVVGARARDLDALLAPLRRHPLVRNVRNAGLMCAIELRGSVIPQIDAQSPAWRVADAMYELGHFTRPLGDAIQLVPPLNATAEQLAGFVGSLASVLDGVERSPA